MSAPSWQNQSQLNKGTHMNPSELNALLTRLKDELARSQGVDASLRQALASLDEDIQRVLAEPPAPADSAAVDGEDTELTAMARELETRLEADHPYLVGTLRELVDRLGKMGI